MSKMMPGLSQQSSASWSIACNTPRTYVSSVYAPGKDTKPEVGRALPDPVTSIWMQDG